MLPELVSVIRTNTNSDGIRGKIFGTNWYYDNQGFSRATSVSSRRSIAGAAEDFDQGKIREKTKMDNHFYFFTEKYLVPRILASFFRFLYVDFFAIITDINYIEVIPKICER